jgi:DNA-binding LacI/PurR family transcriptional regulator
VDVKQTKETPMAAGRPTLDTVADAAGVSRMTVSNAYNRPDQLSAATRQLVLAAASRVGYAGPDPTGASLRLRRTGTVGVVLTEQLPYAFTDPGMVEVLHGLATELSQAQMSLLLVPESGSEDGSFLRHAMVDALVLCSLPPDDPAVTAAQRRQVPLVVVGAPRLRGVPTVGVDNIATAALAAPYLQSLGHTRFAVLTADRSGTGRMRPGFRDRPKGFRDALVGIDPADVTVCTAFEHTRAAAAEAVADMLARPAARRPTALFAVTDVLALGAIEAAHASGVDVPGELSIMGLDDIPDAALSNPPLTTLRQDLFEQGRIAARLSIRLIGGESVRAPRMHADLIVRQSTAPPAR